MFHIYSKIHEWFCTLKTMNGRSLWINGLFSRPNGLTRCIFFHSFHSWKNMQLVSPFGLSKRPFIHTDQPFIVFFVQSFIFFIMNVEKEQWFISREVTTGACYKFINWDMFPKLLIAVMILHGTLSQHAGIVPFLFHNLEVIINFFSTLCEFERWKWFPTKSFRKTFACLKN